MTHTTLQNLPILDETTTKPEAAKHLKSAEDNHGFIPNMYGYMANLPAVMAQYNDGYAAFRVSADFTTIEQEVIFLIVSRTKGCNYCTAAHSMVPDIMSGVPKNVLTAIRTNSQIADPRLATLVDFTEAMMVERGRPDQSLLSNFLDLGFTVTNVFGVILAISVKTLSNDTNHLADTELDDAFQTYVSCPENCLMKAQTT